MKKYLASLVFPGLLLLSLFSAALTSGSAFASTRERQTAKTSTIAPVSCVKVAMDAGDVTVSKISVHANILMGIFNHCPNATKPTQGTDGWFFHVLISCNGKENPADTEEGVINAIKPGNFQIAINRTATFLCFDTTTGRSFLPSKIWFEGDALGSLSTGVRFFTGLEHEWFPPFSQFSAES